MIDRESSFRPMLVFDRTKPPPDTPVEWIDAVNEGLRRLRKRKISGIATEAPTHKQFCIRWIEIFLQAAIRRALSLVEGGLRTHRAGNILVTAFCARALLEDSALVWAFVRRVHALIDEDDSLKLDDYVFSKVLASRLPSFIEKFGDEFKAGNILTAIDQMSAEHPAVRPMYDQLSDVCHPNALGVLWHFADIDDGFMVFDDGERNRDAALHALIFCGLMFAGEEPAISRLEARLTSSK